MTTTDKEAALIAVQQAMLFGINRGAKAERRKQFKYYAFMLLAGVVIGVLVHAIGATL